MRKNMKIRSKHVTYTSTWGNGRKIAPWKFGRTSDGDLLNLLPASCRSAAVSRPIYKMNPNKFQTRLDFNFWTLTSKFKLTYSCKSRDYKEVRANSRATQVPCSLSVISTLDSPLYNQCRSGWCSPDVPTHDYLQNRITTHLHPRYLDTFPDMHWRNERPDMLTESATCPMNNVGNGNWMFLSSVL